MSLPVRITPEAARQVLEIDRWWRANRSDSPELFADEFAEAVRLIGHAPHIGHSYRKSPVPGTRRILLRETRYHLYYLPRGEQVVVLALWHAQRGVGPPLRTS